jgi:outer membrane lipoprotein-sorting protein
MLRLVAVFISFVLLSGTAQALTDQDRVEVERLRVYLNDITTMQTRFVQGDGKGGTAQGTFWLHRPGRLRFEYDPPVPILVIARADFLVHYDKELKEANYLDQKDTPAWFLLADEVTWDDDFTVTGVKHTGPIIEVSATRRSAPEQGAVTLVFDHTPIKLLGWWLVDSSGRKIQVRLQNQQLGIPIDSEMFQFRPTNY